MFWTRQFKIEWIRSTPFVVLILIFLGLRVFTVSLMGRGFPLALWQLFAWALIAQVICSEPFTRRAFWRTRPIPRGHLVFAKALILIGPCLLLPVLAETFLLWRLHPPKGALFWLSADVALRETFLCLLVASIALVSRTLTHALIALGGLWLTYGIFLTDFTSLHSGPIRGRDAETLLVVLCVGIPTLAIYLAVHVFGHRPQPTYRGLGVLLALILAVAAGQRHSTFLPWRLDAAPLEPDPWSEIDRLSFQPVATDDTRLQTIAGRLYADDQLLVALELAPPLPPSHGLRLRRVESAFHLASGETMRFRPHPLQRKVYQSFDDGTANTRTQGQWFCQGRRDLWRTNGLELPEEPCEPSIAFVPIAELNPSLGDPRQLEGVLELTLQVDLFRGTLQRQSHGEGAFSTNTSCIYEPSVPPNVHRRFFSGMLRQHHLPSETVHLLLHPETPGAPPRTVNVRDNGGGNRWYHLMSPMSVVLDSRSFLGNRFKSLTREDDTPISPRETTLVCEEKIYVDRTIVRQRFDLAELDWIVP